jgi:uncharacterized protein YbcI
MKAKTNSEKHLAKTSEGVELVKKCRVCCIERVKDILEKLLDNLLNIKIIGILCPCRCRPFLL